MSLLSSVIGSRIYAWRKQTIERSFAEAKVNHGLRYARMLGIKNMREQCFLTAAVQNIKRLVDSLLFVLIYSKPCISSECRVCQGVFSCASQDTYPREPPHISYVGKNIGGGHA